MRRDLDQIRLAPDAVGEHLTIDISVGVDAVASSAQAERRLKALTRLERLEPRLEVPWRLHDVDTSVAQVLDRQDVVVVPDRLESDDTAQGPV
jgi:hypothetical protein